MKTLLKIIIIFCNVGYSLSAEVITDSTRIDSLRIVLKSLKTDSTRLSKLDSILTVQVDTTLSESEKNRRSRQLLNQARKIYAKEMFWYNFLDTLEVDQPALVSKVKDLRAAYFDSTRRVELAKEGKLARLLTWLNKDSTNKLTRLKQIQRIGVIIYASRNNLIAVREQFKYEKITKRHIARGRFFASEGFLTGFIFDNTNQFDNQLANLRQGYEFTEIRD